MLRKSLFFLFLVICLACSKKHFLYQTWLPVYVEEDSVQGSLKSVGVTHSIISFEKDNYLNFHNVFGDYDERMKTSSLNENIFTLPEDDETEKKYEILKLEKDSLILKYHALKDENSTFYAKYFPLPNYKVESTAAELKFFLLSNYWEFEVDSFRYEIEFFYNKRADTGWSGDNRLGYTCLVQSYRNNRYQNSSSHYWNLSKVGDTFVITIDELTGTSYNTFYLSQLSDERINTVTWSQNDKREISFKRIVYNLDDWNNKLLKLRSKDWYVNESAVIEDEYYEVLNLLKIQNAKKVHHDSVIEASDLQNEQLRYSFQDETFQIYKRDKLLLKGNWTLHPNGKVIYIYSNNEQENFLIKDYSIPGGSFYIQESNNDGFLMLKEEELYINDSTFKTELTLQKWR
ncbi:hypothetical protein [Chondrinema litorale]|uniref:hypothetical protein n=1 Tax=Chondrinema litorale TaxID=2994555 RepID=UPI002543099F|nr:hypothetical protein [Chondrinema litorale]UZR93905.1 hypothetical protein OQ292_18835 [Chondrinema litorale]